jgi:hypothetical protein
MSVPTPTLLLPYAGENFSYVALPASGDDGFPQAFLLDMGGVVYRVTFGISFSDPSLVLSPDYAGIFIDLPDPVLGLFLNLTLELENLPSPSRMLGISRVVPDIPMVVGPLVFLFSRIKIAQANLSGPGQFGSEVLGQVAVANG